MKRNLGLVLALSALVMTAGCKKNLKSDASVNLAGGAKAGFAVNTDWQMPSISGRLIRYDIGSGKNSDCILSYDVGNGRVTMTQFSNGNSTTLFSPTTGFVTDNFGTISVTTDNGDITDQYNEVGGVHVISYDAGATGHEDHILYYIPLHGVACLMHYIGGGTANWHVDWQSGITTGSGSGIGGYDLRGITDKIITYDYGSGEKKELILYRPGYGFIWVVVNVGTGASPIWGVRVQASGGLGGYDLKGFNDQLVTIGGPVREYMDLAAFRPGLGFVWLLQHTPNSTSWLPLFADRTGLSGFSFLNTMDRMVSINDKLLSAAPADPEDDGDFLCYRPGAGTGATAVYEWPGGGTPSPFHYTFNGTNASSLLTSNDDHILSFCGDGDIYNSSLLFYSPGAAKQSQLYYLSSPGSNTYNEAY